MRRIVVTGTDTEVGKTYATAALAQALLLAGETVTVVKPVQTGVDPGEPGDADEVNRIVGVPVAQEWQRLALPLAPETVAFETGTPLMPVADMIDRLAGLDTGVVIVEGAGGVLVRLDGEGNTIADLAGLWDAEVVIVTRDALGTLNHTGLTVEHLRSRELEPVLMIGSATDAGARNQRELIRLTGCPVVGRVPAGRPEDAEFDRGWLTS
ncbi:MAG TPA: dethiobiotin synthase [Aeromicrobium sp.]|nr:dethiobiotin synthase [Aeromicrobium sp.]